jgi:tyrosinase
MTTQVQVGPHRTVATIHHRRSVAKLGAHQLAALRKAFAGTKKLDDERGFWYFAGWHGEPFGWCEHHTDLFLPWHRAYLHYFELALQAQVPGVSLPWWDWTTSAEIPAAYTEPQVDGDPNPLLGDVVRVYRSDKDQKAPPRAPGAAAKTRPPHVDPLPYKDKWDHAMAATSFAEFQERIEEAHDSVHVWVGGIMQDIEWAAYDPLFFAHHVMVDRAWRLWQTRNPGALPRQDLLDVALRPNGMTVRQTLNVRRLGYEYAGTAAHAPGNI